ncbi:hypothetical protein NMG60_11031222 [Bertholletia excelsa]
MAKNFDRWEKDPFFSVAEEVQESADRMESTYRTWIHSRKDSSGTWNSEELRRDLRTALGTTKWQLEEFENAVKSSYTNSSDDDAKERHREFVLAIENQILKIESSLREAAKSDGKPPKPWVSLDESECKELALFLSGSLHIDTRVEQSAEAQKSDRQSMQACSNNSLQSMQLSSSEVREDKLSGHRRTASASADIGAWKIAVTEDDCRESSSNGHSGLPPRKIPSFSALFGTMETACKSTLSKNGYRKLKNMDRHGEDDIVLPQTQPLTRGLNTCYERSKSCLDHCDDCYDKQLYGWYGAIQRLLQRSQYQVQYGRPLQLVFWSVLLLCSIVLFSMRAI